MSRVIIILLLTMVILGAALKESGTTQESLENTTSKMNYDTMNISIEDALRDGISEDDPKYLNFIKIVIGKYADVFLYAGIEGMKESIKYGYEHPNFNFRTLLWIITAYFLLSLTIPIIYIISFVWFGVYSIKIWFKEFKKKRR